MDNKNKNKEVPEKGRPKPVKNKKYKDRSLESPLNNTENLIYLTDKDNLEL